MKHKQPEAVFKLPQQVMINGQQTDVWPAGVKKA